MAAPEKSYTGYIYIARADVHDHNWVKIGSTKEYKSRLNSYRTGCPPFCDSKGNSYLIKFVYVVEVKCTNSKSLKEIENRIHNEYHPARGYHIGHGSSEWFNIRGGYQTVINYITKQDWVIKVIDLECYMNTNAEESKCPEYKPIDNKKCPEYKPIDNKKCP